MKNKAQRQDEAKERQKAYDGLSLDEKIQNCKNRRGKSHRELSRLLAVKNSNSAK